MFKVLDDKAGESCNTYTTLIEGVPGRSNDLKQITYGEKLRNKEEDLTNLKFTTAGWPNKDLLYRFLRFFDMVLFYWTLQQYITFEIFEKLIESTPGHVRLGQVLGNCDLPEPNSIIQIYNRSAEEEHFGYT